MRFTVLRLCFFYIKLNYEITAGARKLKSEVKILLVYAKKIFIFKVIALPRSKITMTLKMT